ncbi:MAG: HAMP domain-containing protein [Duodenibacillus sp.]|nr:HAMP domain-containing protein [Duodenibacillus sp.]
MARPKATSSLFWRTFILLSLLIVFTAVGWIQSYRVLNELPYASNAARQITTLASLTRYALITADPIYRADLLYILASRHGLRVLPREPEDAVTPLANEYTASNSIIIEDIEGLVRQDLGQDTVLASSVNAERGLWVSVNIDDDAYWIKASSSLLKPPYGTTWLWWALSALIASVLLTTFIAHRLVSPLARLTECARVFGRGDKPPALPEASGPEEIREVNKSFNRMVEDITRMERDREMLLAGVSHDLRTPITRLMLETEMAGLPEETRANMVSDLEQMHSIVNQFMDYARRSTQKLELVSLSDTVFAVIGNMRLEVDPSVRLTTDVEPGVYVKAHPLELSRVVQNIFTNAMRYGRGDDGMLTLNVRLTKDAEGVKLAIADSGAGLDMTQADRLMRPFERGESARSGATGSGLGLAIVDRIVRRSKGRVQLSTTAPHGLTVTVVMPEASQDAGKEPEPEEEEA